MSGIELDTEDTLGIEDTEAGIPGILGVVVIVGYFGMLGAMLDILG